MLPMKILALDTALTGCGVCVYDADTGDAQTMRREMGRGQVEHLIPMAQQAMDKAGVAFADLDMITTTIGPGAFTGVRIGLSAARGFALSLGKPLIGLTTLDVLAAQYFEANKGIKNQCLAVILETKRRDFYFQIFDDNGTAVTDAIACSGADIVTALSDYNAQNIICVGDAIERFQGENGDTEYQFIDGFGAIDAAVLARLGHNAYMSNADDFATLPAPLYLRPPDVSQPKRKPRILSAS